MLTSMAVVGCDPDRGTTCYMGTPVPPTSASATAVTDSEKQTTDGQPMPKEKVPEDPSKP